MHIRMMEYVLDLFQYQGHDYLLSMFLSNQILPFAHFFLAIFQQFEGIIFMKYQQNQMEHSQYLNF